MAGNVALGIFWKRMIISWSRLLRSTLNDETYHNGYTKYGSGQQIFHRAVVGRRDLLHDVIIIKQWPSANVSLQSRRSVRFTAPCVAKLITNVAFEFQTVDFKFTAYNVNGLLSGNNYAICDE